MKIKRVKPIYEIHWHNALRFSYYRISDGKKQGEWDIFAITKKDRSYIPQQFRNVLHERLKHWKSKEWLGRTILALQMAAMEAGVVCGFNSKLENKQVFWTIKHKNRTKFVVSIATLHNRWRRKDLRRKMTKKILKGKSLLRFVVDNNPRHTIWSLTKNRALI
jgi:hypothetical protein